MAHRRRLPKGESPEDWAARGLLKQKIGALLASNQEIQLVLPGFPFKSINRQAKVIGELPDEGERLALINLGEFANELARYSPAGVRLIIVSDGRVYSDLLGVSEEAVASYTAALREMNTHVGIHFTDLKDLLALDDSNEARKVLLEQFAIPLELVREQVLHDAERTSLYVAFSRFLCDDLPRLDGESSLAHRRRCKALALHFMQRNDAYAKLIAAKLPEVIRLSIHPYPGSSEKVGINLISNQDGVGTPWHNVVLWQKNGRPVLMHRKLAEQRGAILRHKFGRGFYFEEV